MVSRRIYFGGIVVGVGNGIENLEDICDVPNPSNLTAIFTPENGWLELEY